MKAFPTPTFSINDAARVTAVGGEGGMDLRDYFAAKAMQGLLAAGRDAQYGCDDMERLAASSYSIANEMMKAREA